MAQAKVEVIHSSTDGGITPMKSRSQKQQEAVQRNLRHVSKYIAAALKQYPPSEARDEQRLEMHQKRMQLIRHKLGIPANDISYDSALLIPALKAAAKEAA